MGEAATPLTPSTTMLELSDDIVIDEAVLEFLCSLLDSWMPGPTKAGAR